MIEIKSTFAITLVLVCVLAGSAGQILWKQGMAGMSKISGFEELLGIKTLINIFTNKYIIFGVFLYALSVILWLGALSTLDVSFAYPMLSLGYIVTAIFSIYLFGENITVVRWLGIALIVLGCVFIKSS
jgi:multidrug transporter EmrE-like cation transporter